jgi:hypothetical protein
MMPQEDWDDILLYLADQQALGLACARLERLAGPWPGDLRQLEQAMELASQQGLHEFFLLYLISRVLLAGPEAPAWLRGWLRRNRTLGVVLPGLSLRKALSLEWLAVPVPIVGFDGRGGAFRMMMARRGGGGEVVMPQWASESLDSACLEAISHALAAARGLGSVQGSAGGFYCWPMLDPKGPLIRGESLGLPLALAMSLLDRGLAWPATLMATGSITAGGQVLPVGGLEAKVQAAAALGVKLFLYPDDEKIDFAEWPIPALPVKDLAQAMTFAQLVALGLPAASNFRLYYACLHDSELMLDNFHQIPPSLLLWARDRGLLGKIDEQARDIQGFARLVARLSDSALSLEHKEVLASLLGEEKLKALAARSSQDALMASNWYNCLVALAEERNEPEQARLWRRKAGKVFRAFGNKIYVFYRTEEHNQCYERFDQEFSRCLEALGEGALTRLVGRTWGRGLVYIHLPIRQEDHVSARVFLSEDNRVRALSLNALNLGIDPDTGDAQDMVDCVYAVYLGLIRAAFVINREALLAEAGLHRLLAGYLRGLLAGMMPADGARARADEALLTAACDLHYGARFLGLESEQALAWPAEPGQAAGDAVLKTKLRACAEAEGLSQMMHLAGLTPHPAWLEHRLAASLEREALACLNGVLDNFMGLCVLSSYSAETFLGKLPSLALTGQRVEAILLPYLEGIEFASQAESPGRTP